MSHENRDQSYWSGHRVITLSLEPPDLEYKAASAAFSQQHRLLSHQRLHLHSSAHFDLFDVLRAP